MRYGTLLHFQLTGQGVLDGMGKVDRKSLVQCPTTAPSTHLPPPLVIVVNQLQAGWTIKPVRTSCDV